VGIIDLKTGLIEYIDAGHEPPLIRKKEGTVVELKKHGGLALAIEGDYEYNSQTMTLAPGDTFFLYTDGATDVYNHEKVRFGLPKLKEYLASMPIDATPKEINDKFLTDIKEYIGEEDQFDDITVLTIHYKP
jgi:sigma-B regulation protein RsbU (phosphoserine phosphatase)